MNLYYYVVTKFSLICAPNQYCISALHPDQIYDLSPEKCAEITTRVIYQGESIPVHIFVWYDDDDMLDHPEKQMEILYYISTEVEQTITGYDRMEN